MNFSLPITLKVSFFYNGSNYSLNSNAALSKVLGIDNSTGEIVNYGSFISSTSLVKSVILLGGGPQFQLYSIIDLRPIER